MCAKEYYIVQPVEVLLPVLVENKLSLIRPLFEEIIESCGVHSHCISALCYCLAGGLHPKDTLIVLFCS